MYITAVFSGVQIFWMFTILTGAMKELRLPQFFTSEDFIIMAFLNVSKVTGTPCKTAQYTIQLLSIRTNRLKETVQTQIKLLLQEQFDPSLHCLPFLLHIFGPIVVWWNECSNFTTLMTNHWRCPSFILVLFSNACHYHTLRQDVW